MKLTRVMALMGTTLLMSACSAPKAEHSRFEVAQYKGAFETAKTVLRELDFSLERVDAYSGVITTKPKSSAGLGTPWDQEQSTVKQEFEDLLDRQSRVVRVSFEPASGAAGRTATLADKRQVDGPMIVRVSVEVFRTQRPGWRLETSAIRSSTHTSDPNLARAGMEPSYETPAGEDTLLADRIAREISVRSQTPAADHGIMAERRGEPTDGSP